MKRLLASLVASFKVAVVCLSMMSAVTLFGQDNLKLLNVQETTSGYGVYPCGDRHEAMVQFVTLEPFGLTFESTHDTQSQMNITVDSIAGKKTYSIVFVTQEPGRDYSNRRLTIRVPGFQDYRMPLPLKDKQLFEYTVSDPYSVLRSPFFTYLEKAQESFNNSEYQKAKDNYELCRYCPEYLNDTANILQHIQLCDSMLLWYNQAVEADHFFRYHEASNAYSKLLIYDGSEKLRQALYSAQRNFDRDCEAMVNLGLKELDEGHLDRASQLFNQVIDNSCTRFAKQANENLDVIRKERLRRDSHSSTFILEWSPQNDMFGFTSGSFYNNKAYGWYFTLMGNEAFIEHFTARVKGEYKDGVFKYEKEWTQKGNDDLKSPDKLEYEACFSTGPTWHIWLPIYIHAGFGGHYGGFFSFDEEEYDSDVKFNKYNPEKMIPNDYTKKNIFGGGDLEAGIVLKYFRVALKFTYRRTFWAYTGDYKDFCKENVNNFQFGVGFCW